MDLLIVESPTKAKTISKFLDKKFEVKSSFGHIRDLPERQMGIDVANNFEPKYVIPTKNKAAAAELIKLAKDSGKVYYATDEDREGEAIAWHLSEILKHENGERITFHEITKDAIKEALERPRKININLVNAQQARRILDRLVGYELSPFLWRKLTKGLSAGRVQSVALRLIVEREREILNFKSEEYWTIEGEFTKQEGGQHFIAKLQKINENTLEKFSIKKENEAKKIIDDLVDAEFFISSIERKESQRAPLPPFTTSTLQQEANKKLGFSSKQTMLIAQQLYEGVELGGEGHTGLITYMRTDSVNLSDKFLRDAHNEISKNFGKNYAKTRQFKTKSKGAQEAHEAIRPTEARRTPENLRNTLNDQQYKLYDLIWKRAVASQMSAAVIDSTVVDISNKDKENIYIFRANGMTIKFDGFLKIYPDSQKEVILPKLSQNENLYLEKAKGSLSGLLPKQHFTEPPAKYSDATLVKALEERGIGRPSTYAPIISTLIERKYAERLPNRRLEPKEIAFVVNDLLVKHFPKIVDFEFTAKMEKNLDYVASGKKDWTKIVKAFYDPFKENLTQKEKEISKKELTEEETDEICEKCGSKMVIKMGRYGKFLACSAFPKCKNAKPLVKKDEEQEGEKQSRPAEKCELCGGDMELTEGRYGRYFRCKKYPDCKFTKRPVKSIGIKCPACSEGEIIERKSKKGRKFYGCSKFPKCKFALWYRPVQKEGTDQISMCEKCGKALVFRGKDEIKCSNQECPENK